MRQVIVLLIAILAAIVLLGCARAPLDRQACVECALRDNPAPAALDGAPTEFARWCEEGEARACSVLGVMYEHGRGVPTNAAHAARLYGRACRRGNVRACVSLGRLIEAGRGARPDAAGAVTLYSAACDAGELDGCEQLGRSLADAGERRRAAAVLRRACRRGHPPSCETLGTLLEEGHGVTRSLERAQALYRRACRGGLDSACARL